MSLAESPSRITGSLHGWMAVQPRTRNGCPGEKGIVLRVIQSKSLGMNYDERLKQLQSENSARRVLVLALAHLMRLIHANAGASMPWAAVGWGPARGARCSLAHFTGPISWNMRAQRESGRGRGDLAVQPSSKKAVLRVCCFLRRFILAAGSLCGARGRGGRAGAGAGVVLYLYNQHATCCP
jgi:hypothetical protein